MIVRTGVAPANAAVLVTVATLCPLLPTPTLPKAIAAGERENAATPPVPVSGIEASTTPWLSDMTRLAALPPPDVGENTTSIAQVLPPESEVSAVQGAALVNADVCSENCAASVPVIVKTGVTPGNVLVFVTVATLCPPLPTPTVPKAIAAGVSENVATPPAPVIGTVANAVPLLSDMTKLAALPPADVGENSTSITQAAPLVREVSAVQGGLLVNAEVTSENCAASGPAIDRPGTDAVRGPVLVTVTTFVALLPTTMAAKVIGFGEAVNVVGDVVPVPLMGTVAPTTPPPTGDDQARRLASASRRGELDQRRAGGTRIERRQQRHTREAEVRRTGQRELRGVRPGDRQGWRRLGLAAGVGDRGDDRAAAPHGDVPHRDRRRCHAERVSSVVETGRDLDLAGRRRQSTHRPPRPATRVTMAGAIDTQVGVVIAVTCAQGTPKASSEMLAGPAGSPCTVTVVG